MRTRAGVAIVAVSCALPLLVLALVVKLGVNVPFSDEWTWTPIVYAARHGNLTLDMLWQPLNEHRMFFGKLLVVALSEIGSWNLVREELLSVLLCVASQWVLWRLLRRTVPAIALPLTFFAASLSLWNLGQAENFAMGLQLDWFLLQLCLLVVVWRLTAPGNAVADVLIAGAAATVASYCSEIGLLAWPIGLFAIVLVREHAKRTAVVWFLWGVAVFALYRVGYIGAGPGHVSAADNLAPVVAYCLAYLGLPVAFWLGLYPCIAAGILLVSALAVIVVRDLRHGDRDTFVRSMPWYALALFALLAAIGTAPNRAGLGLQSAVTSTRYILIASWLPIALAALLAMRRPDALDVRRRRATPISLAIVAVIAMTSVSWARGIRDWQHFSFARRADVVAIRERRFSDLAPYYPNRPALMSELGEFEEIEGGPPTP